MCVCVAALTTIGRLAKKDEYTTNNGTFTWRHNCTHPFLPHIFTHETRVFFARQKRLALLITATDDVCLIVIQPSCFPLFELGSLIVVFTREIVLFLKPLSQYTRQYL